MRIRAIRFACHALFASARLPQGKGGKARIPKKGLEKDKQSITKGQAIPKHRTILCQKN